MNITEGQKFLFTDNGQLKLGRAVNCECCGTLCSNNVVGVANESREAALRMYPHVSGVPGEIGYSEELCSAVCAKCEEAAIEKPKA